MARTAIQPVDMADPRPRYTHGWRVGNTVYVAGQLALDKAGGLVGPNDIRAQTRRVLENVRRVRERFGDRLELIATGGIDSPESARQALAAGATACGIFTGFITRGPLLPRRILDALQATEK